MSDERPSLPAPGPAEGFVAEGFEPLAQRFADHLEQGEEVGAALAVYVGERCVADLWGGKADLESGRAWERDTRVVVFSVSKAFTAMAFHLLAAKGAFEWDEPVSRYWPGFGRNGKQDITVRTLANHNAGLAAIDGELTLAQCTDPSQRPLVVDLLERQRPYGTPGQVQGYHATTHGLFLGELFQQITGEELGTWLHRELLEPLGSDVRLGTPAELDHLAATLYPVSTPARLAMMLSAAATAPESTEGRMARQFIQRDSVARNALMRPSLGSSGIGEYDETPARRACLPWASATGSAQGVARAFLPFANGGKAVGRKFFTAKSLEPLFGRQTWSMRDDVLQKPIGWSQAFLKEERHVFCPNAPSFGHAGMGGALGWCCPVTKVSMGYVLNRMDWRIRSPRAMGLCHALWECEPLLG